MRVVVVLNPRAGRVQVNEVRSTIEEALFRIRMDWVQVKEIPRLTQMMRDIQVLEADGLVIVGGDGTVHHTLKAIQMAYPTAPFQNFPPITLCPLGTANDLARGLMVPSDLKRSVRLALEGVIRMVDVIKVTGDVGSDFTLTTGGFGIPALTAQYANEWRSKNRLGIKKLGSLVYVLGFLDALKEWSSESWGLEIITEGGRRFYTKSPFVLINNQRSLGQFFKIAPFTQPDDGQFNVSSLPYLDPFHQILSVWKSTRGLHWEDPKYFSFETRKLTVKRTKKGQPLKYFADGEVFEQNFNEVLFECEKQVLPVMVNP